MNSVFKQYWTEESQESSSSREQQRILETEKEKAEQLNEANKEAIDELSIIHQAEIISFTDHPVVAKLVGKAGTAEAPENELLSTLFQFLEQGMSIEELTAALTNEIEGISLEISKNNKLNKKRLFEVMVFLRTMEQSLKTQQNPELKSNLQQLQEKISSAAKASSPENALKALNSLEMKSSLRQSVELARQQPENIRSSYENIASRLREGQLQNQLQNSQQLNSQQQSAQRQQQLQVNRPDTASAQLSAQLRQAADSRLQVNAQMQNIQADRARIQQSAPPAATQTAPQKQETHQPRQDIPQVRQTAQQINPDVQTPKTEQTIQSAKSGSLQTEQNAAVTQNSSAKPETAKQLEHKLVAKELAANNISQSAKAEPEQKPLQSQVAIKPEAKQEAKAETKPERTDAPPTSGHVHSGNCCGQNNANILAPPAEIKAAVEKGLSEEQRTAMLRTAQESAGIDAARAANLNQNLSQSAQRAF